MLHGFDRHLAEFNSRPRYGDHPIRVWQAETGRLAVAISSQTGSGALEVAGRLAVYLRARVSAAEPPWRVFGRDLMAKVLEDHHLPTHLARLLPEDANNALGDMLDELLGLHPPSSVVVQQTVETILNLVRAGNVILVGWGVNVVAGRLTNVLHVRLVASLERRIARIQAREQLSRREALAFIERSDRGRARYVRRYFHQEVADELQYALIINTDRCEDEEVVRLIGDWVVNRQRLLGEAVRARATSATVT